MYELDSTRQKFDIGIGATFLSDNATRPVERAAEMRQPIQTSKFCRILKFVELYSTRQKCDARTGPKINWTEIPDKDDASYAYKISTEKYVAIYDRCFPLKRKEAKTVQSS